jgi:hypothetical protein
MKSKKGQLARFKHQFFPGILPILHTLIEGMPPELQWSVELTDDTSAVVPADFRIYVEGEAGRVALRTVLGYGLPAEETDDTETHHPSKYLSVTIIEV